MSQEIIIKNIEGLSENQIRDLVNKGGKFVIYTYWISIVIMTFKRSSNIHFIKPGNSAITPGLGLLFVSLILGWWGLPWGPIYTIGSIFNILTGGKDVTYEVISYINQNDPNYGNSGYGQGLNSSSEYGANLRNNPPTYNIS